MLPFGAPADTGFSPKLAKRLNRLLRRAPVSAFTDGASSKPKWPGSAFPTHSRGSVTPPHSLASGHLFYSGQVAFPVPARARRARSMILPRGRFAAI